MSCGCGKPKCNGKCGVSPAVLQINNNECTLFHKVDVPASLGDSETNPPKPGAYRNVLLYYEADENAFLYTSDGIPVCITGVSTDYDLLKNKPSINGVVLIENKTLAELGIIDAIDSAVAAEAVIREEEDGKLSKAIDDEEADRIAADNRLWDEIETIEAASDVVDVVGTYAELQAYDTSKLHDNDLIKVLQDETRDDAITYYRWSTTTETFSYVGEEGPYYTQSETDTLLAAKQDNLIAGTNIQIAADGKTISATDTTYTAGSGLDLTGTEFSVDTTTIQEKLTAGTNVQISNQNVISATDTTYTAGTGLTLSGAEFSADNSVVAFKSDLPTKTSDLTNDGADGTSTYAETDELPTKTSDLTNDGDDGTSPYATQDYVDTYGGKIDKIEVNGVEQTITNKTVDITVPTKTSDITNDGSDGTSTYVENDDLALDLATKQDKLVAGSNIQIAADGKTISATDTTYSVMTGATSQDAGTSGLVPAPAAGDNTKYLSGDGVWKTISQYQLPIASDSTLGGVKVGSNLSIDSSTGVLSANVNNATLTIQKNSTTIDTFTANASSNKTINITVPTKISDLTNTSGGFVTYCTCSSAADATTKTATVDSGDSNWTLRKGTIVGVKYTNTNTASATKLNVGGSGDKSVYYNTAVYTGTSTIVWGNANRFVFYMYDGTNWVWISDSRHDGNDNTYTTAYCNTAAGTAAKTATMTNYVLTANRYTVLTITNANTYAGALTLNINGKGAKPLYINGVASSSSNYTLAAGSYIVYYDGTNYHIYNNGEIPRMIHSENPSSVVAPSSTVPGSSITDGSITFAKTATGEFLKLQLSTVDIGEGASLPANTLYGVYE